MIADPPKASTGVLQLVLKTECREHGPQSNASLSYKKKKMCKDGPDSDVYILVARVKTSTLLYSHTLNASSQTV